MKKVGILTAFILSIIIMPTSLAFHVNKIDYPKNTSFTYDYKPHVVVAVLDSGINVYHEVFRR